MSIAEKLQTIAENEQKVYDAGKQAEYDAFWDAYQDNGGRTGWKYAFSGIGWKPDVFKPKYHIKVANGTSMFEGNTNITDFADYLGDTEMDFSEAGVVQYMFRGCDNLTRIHVCGGGYYSYTFYALTKLHTIDKWIITEFSSQGFNEAFSHCTKLANINEIVGHFRAKVDFHYCPLTHDSLMNILNALYDYSGGTTTYTLTLGSTNLAKLTDAEKAIATQKGWTLA